MNRNETFDQAQAARLDIKLAWATLEAAADDVSGIQLMVSGSESDVSDLKIAVDDGKLTVEQPVYGISYHVNTEHWMEVYLRIPRAWKGAVSAYTTTGPMTLKKLSGTDITLETVTGDLKASGIEAMNLALKTASGQITGSALTGTKLGVRTVTGGVTLDGCAFRAYRLNTVSGDISLAADAPYESAEGSAVTGNVRFAAPVSEADVLYRGVTGRLRTQGVSLKEGAPEVRVSSVTGSLELIGTDAPQAPEIPAAQ